MKSVSEIDAVRKQGILSSLAGFPILLVFGIAWIAAGSLSFVVPPNFVLWVYKTTIYLVLGIIVAVGPFALAVLFGRRSMHYTGFFVGSVLLIGAWLVRAHARAVWVASRK